MAHYPVYGEIVSWNGVSFAAGLSYLVDGPLEYNAPTAMVPGKLYPLDLLAGGPAPLRNTDYTWRYAIVTPDTGYVGTESTYVETQVAAIYAAAAANQVGTLTVKSIVTGGNVTVPARLISAQRLAAQRSFAHIELDIIFRLYQDFS